MTVGEASRAGIGFAGAFVSAALALGAAACAGIVGANFSDEHLRTDGGTASSGDAGTCPTGLADCDGTCADLATSPHHCGRCDVACPDDPNGTGVCVNLHCAFVCAQGWVECAGGCCDPDAGGASNDAGETEVGVACGSGAGCAIASNSFCCSNNGSDTCDTDPDDPCDYEMYCDRAAQCGAGEVCCFDTAMGGSGCAGGCVAGQTQLCDPNASNECASGASCSGSLAPGGTTYTACQ